MEIQTQDKLLFFGKNTEAFPLYQAYEKRLLEQFPKTKVKVQKSQITFSNRHVFACVSFLQVKKKAQLPEPYFVLTLGLPYSLDSSRVAAKTEPYPGRWTTHIVISSLEEIDDELFSWTQQAYDFAENK